MTTFAEKIINPLSEWYRTSVVKSFWEWWTSSLLEWVPENKRKLLFPNTEQIYILPDGDDAKLWIKQDSKVTILPNNEVVESHWWHQLNHHVRSTDIKSMVSYLLSPEDVLIREITLPAAAAGNIGSVLQYELDKYIPFNKEDVIFSYQSLSDAENAEKIPVTLVVVQKSLIEKIEQEISNKSLQLAAIDVNVSDEKTPKAMGVNLLTESLRIKKDWTKVKVNLVFFIVLCLMVWFVMFNSLENKNQKIERLEVLADQLRGQARRAKLLETELEQSISAANFLGHKKTDTVSPVIIINELTRLIPKNSYLTRIILDDEKVEIVGQSDNANALVPILNQSKLWFEPSIVGQVMPDARTGKEKFTIKADLKLSEEVNDEA